MATRFICVCMLGSQVKTVKLARGRGQVLHVSAWRTANMQDLTPIPCTKSACLSGYDPVKCRRLKEWARFPILNGFGDKHVRGY